MKMRKIFAPTFALATMLFCMPLISCSQTEAQQSSQDAQTLAQEPTTQTDSYTIYVGTTSQTSLQPVMDADEAESLLGDLALNYCDGYTIYEAKGGWKDAETGAVYQEDTIVIVLSGITLDQARDLADDAAHALDQKSILIEHDMLETEYYVQ